MAAGQSYTISVQYKNIGTTTWWVGSAYKLQIQNPVNNTTWGITRLASSSNVAPGATGTFTGVVVAPTTAGVYNLQWKPIEDSISLGFGPLSTNVAVTVAVAADAARYVSKTGAVTVNAGSDFYVQNTMQNVGTNTWTTASGYSMYAIFNNWGYKSMFMPGATPSVPQGSQVTFTRLVTAPITTGTYPMQWQMLHGSTLFGDKTPYLNITVVQGNDNAQFISQAGVPTSVVHGTSFSVTITMKNLGLATWSTAGGYSLKSMNPAGNTTWGPSSIAVSGSVAPNANGTFTTTFTAPATPGTYHFQWRMNHGSTAFGQYTADATITVT
jgi:hypothetical protein